MSNIEKAFEFIPDLSLLNDIEWDFFDSSFLVYMKVGLDQYKIITSYKLPTKKFQKSLYKFISLFFVYLY